MTMRRGRRNWKTLLAFESLEARRLLSTDSSASNWPYVLTTDTSPTAAAPQINTTTQYSLRELVNYYNSTYDSDSMPMTIDLTGTTYTLTETTNASSVEGGRNNNENQYGALDILPTHTDQPLIIVGTTGTILTCDFVTGTTIPLDRLLHVMGGTLQLEDVTLKGGEAKDNSTGQYTDALGGAVLVNPGGTLSLTSCQVRSNKAVASTDAIVGQATGIRAAGGGVYGSAGSVINIKGSTTFLNNQVFGGNGGTDGATGLPGGAAYGGGLAIGANVNEPSATDTPTSTTLSFTANSGANASFTDNLVNLQKTGAAVGATGGTGSQTGGDGGNAYGGGLYMGAGSVTYPTTLKIDGGSSTTPLISATPLTFSGNEVAGGPGYHLVSTGTFGEPGAAYGAGAYLEPGAVKVTDGTTTGGILTFSGNADFYYTGYTTTTTTTTTTIGTTTTTTTVTTYNPTTAPVTAGLETPPIAPSAAAYAASTLWSLTNALAAMTPLAVSGMTVDLLMGPTVTNGGFESPALANGNYDYYTGQTEGDWAFTGDAGISSNSSAFTDQNPSAPQGTQVAFLQETGGMSQAIGGFIPGDSYSISFEAAQRSGYPASSVTVSVNGTSIGTYSPTGTTYQTFTTKASDFLATTGYNTITFTGVDASGTDQTVFIDNVQIVQSTSSTYSGGVTISSTGKGKLVIIGAGVSSTLISAAGLTSSVLTISPGANVSFLDLTIEDGTASYGGGINASSAAVTLSSVSVVKNTSSSHGGGIYQFGGTLTLTNNTRIVGNSSAYGGGISINSATFTMNTGQVRNNKASYQGGGFSAFDNCAVKFSDASISSNSVTGYNSIDQYTFQGGGLYQYSGGSLSVLNSKVNNNSSTLEGGGIFIVACDVTVTGSKVQGNKAGSSSAQGSTQVQGGGIYIGQQSGETAKVTTVTVSKNGPAASSALQGGGMYDTGGTLSVKNTKMLDNSATEGAGIYQWSSTFTMSGGQLTGNIAANYGGALYFVGTPSMPVSLSNVTVSNNSTDDGQGGGIQGTDVVLTLTNCTFSDNTAMGDAGAVFVNGSSKLTISGGSITGNKGYNGGAILAKTFNGGNPSVKISGASISSNTSSLSGGGIFELTGTLRITNSTLKSNTAIYDGGAVYASGVDNILSSAVIESNSLSGSGATDGGGLYLIGGALNTKGLIVTNNTITATGGQAIQGGGIYASGTAITFNGSNSASTTTISDNTLTGNGGGNAYGAGICVNQSTLATSGGLTVEGNAATSTGSSAQLQGGGIDDVSGPITFGATLIVSGNTLAGQSGGSAGGAGIQAVSAAMTVYNGVSWTLEGNTISGVQDAAGAGINFTANCSFSSSTPSVSGNTVTSPISTTGGGSGPVGSNLAFTVADVNDDNSGATSVSSYTNTSGSLRDAVSWAESSLLPFWNSVAIQLSNTASNYQLGTQQPLTMSIPSGESLVLVSASTNADIQGIWNQTIIANGSGDLAFEGVNISGGYVYSTSNAEGGGIVLSGSGTLTLINAAVEQNKAIGAQGYHTTKSNTWNNNKTRSSSNGGNGAGGGIYQASGNLYLLGNTVVKNNTASGGIGGTGTNGNGVAGRIGKTGGDGFGGGIFQTGGTLYLGQDVRIQNNHTFGGKGGTGGASKGKQGGNGGLGGSAWAGGVDTEQGATINFPNGYENTIMQSNIATFGDVGSQGKGSSNYNPNTSDPSSGAMNSSSNFYNSGQVVSSYQGTKGGSYSVVGQGMGMSQSGGTLSLGAIPQAVASGNSALGGGLAGGVLPGVTVELFNAQGGLVATATSGSDGHFDFRTQFTGLGYCEVVPVPSFEIAPLGTMTAVNIPSSFDPGSRKTALLQFYEGVAVNQSLHLLMRHIDSVLRTGPNYVELVNKENNTVIWRDQLAPPSYTGGFTFAAVDIDGHTPAFVVLRRYGVTSPLLVNARTGAVTFVQGQVATNLQRGLIAVVEDLTGNDGVPDLLLAPSGGRAGSMSVIDLASARVAWTSTNTFQGRGTISFDTFPSDTYDANVVRTNRNYNKRHHGYLQKVLSGETGKLIASGFTPNFAATPINLGPFTTEPNVVARVAPGVPHVSHLRRRGLGRRVSERDLG